MLLEDGTAKLSALAYALSLVKYTTPARRVEVKGGIYRIAAAARDDALVRGAEVQLGARVSQVRASASDVHVVWEQQGVRHERTFDRAILALAPEHVREVRVTGDVAPIVRVLASLTPARITKSNVVFTGGAKTHEHATERYAMWFSANRAKTETTATFFHGWEGAVPLSMQQMWKAALAVSSRRRVVRATSRTWDANVVEHGEFPHGYVSEPRVGECVPLLRAARAHYFGQERHALWCASHALGIGANVREAALTGEWAAVACLRSLGCDIARAFARTADPERELFGATREMLDRALTGSRRP
jgi:hypothetical protein